MRIEHLETRLTPSLTTINVGATLASTPVVMGDELYFTATDSAHGTQLWRSDGTAAGTVMVTDLAARSGGLDPSDLTVVGDALYFTAYDGQTTQQLWESDGTASGTTMVADAGGGTPAHGLYPSDLADVQGTLYFIGWGAGYQVFRSDGTAAGTVPVTSINGDGNSYATDLTVVGATLYFSAYDATDGQQLWALNTDDDTATMLTSGGAGGGGSFPALLTPVGNLLYFADTDSPTDGSQAWVTDGTVAGTRMLTSTGSAGGGVAPSQFTAMGGSVYFEGDTPADGFQLWKTGGTAATTEMLTTINSGSGGFYPQDLTAIGDILYLDGYAEGGGDQVWSTDGTPVGTQEATSIGGSNGALADDLAGVGGTLFFTAFTPSTGYQLWQTDGTVSGTEMDTDLPSVASVEPTDLIAVGGNVFFNATGASMYVWQTGIDPPPAVPTISWPTPAAITYGAALGLTQLDATTDVPGTFSYNPPSGSVLNAGARTLTVTSTPNDTIDYATETVSMPIAVAKITPTANWSPPGPITYGTALGDAQLDATAGVPGTWSYTPAIGSIAGAGTQTLTAIFTPSDAVDYNAVDLSTTIVVARATPTVQLGGGGGVYDGAPLPASAAVAGVDGTSGPSLDGLGPILTYYAGNGAAGTPLSGAPVTVGTYTVVASFPGSADYTGATGAPVTFAITPASTGVSLGASATSAVFGQSLTFTATVTAGAPGAGVPTGTVTFLDDGTPLATVALDATGGAVLTVDDLGLGTQTITAVYGGDADRAGSQSAGVAASVSAGPSRIVLVPRAVIRRKKVVSLSLTAEVQSPITGAAVPTGNVTFLVKKRNLGTVALRGGEATIAPKPGKVLGKSITVTYAGAVDFLPASVTSPRQTVASLRTQARDLAGSSG